MIGVLVVDDSSFMRTSLTHILGSDGSLEVVGTAADGMEAIRKVKELRPGVVLLDIEMPKMDGLAALAHVMAEQPTPVVMLSAVNKRDAAIALKCLEHGAVDFLAKPSGVISYDIDMLSREVITKVKVAAEANVQAMEYVLPKETYLRTQSTAEARKSLVVIGASTGGPRAVAKVLSGLPRDIPAAVVVVQHMAPEFVPSFVERLQWACSLDVSAAQDGDIVEAGRAFIAPGDRQVAVVRDGHVTRIRLDARDPASPPYSSIDHMMESVASVYGDEVLGILLTGLGSDGAMGLEAIKDAGGSTIAEDESSCVVFGMPKAALERGCVDKIMPLPQVAEAIMDML